MELDRNKIAELMKADRAKAGPNGAKLSQARYANLLGLEQGQISKIENCKMSEFTHPVVLALEKRFDQALQAAQYGGRDRLVEDVTQFVRGELSDVFPAMAPEDRHDFAEHLKRQVSLFLRPYRLRRASTRRTGQKAV